MEGSTAEYTAGEYGTAIAISYFSDRLGREVFNYLIRREDFPKMLFLGTDRSMYIKAPTNGNKNRYDLMMATFAEIIFRQKLEKVRVGLERVVQPPPCPCARQLSIYDYVSLDS